MKIICRRLRQKVPQTVWVIFFLLICLALPLLAQIWFIAPSWLGNFETLIALAKIDIMHAIVLTIFLFLFKSIPMFYVNFAFVSMRAAAGYCPSKYGSITTWLLSILKKHVNSK